MEAPGQVSENCTQDFTELKHTPSFLSFVLQLAWFFFILAYFLFDKFALFHSGESLSLCLLIYAHGGLILNQCLVLKN
jgi:hypothetical protein